MAYSRKKTSSNFLNGAFLQGQCVFEDAFAAYTGRWTANIVLCIHHGSDRFGLIKRKLVKISDRVLGLRLKQLVEQGLVTKSDVDGDIRYALTADGSALIDVLGQIARWQMQRKRKKKS